MMATTTGRPGVYITENFNPIITATWTGNAIPAIAAVHPRGPTTPMLVSSWNQYVTYYGTFAQVPNSILPFAVYEYFANGGAQVYVLRVANTDAEPASLSIVNDNALQDLAGNPALGVASQSPGVWGQGLFVQIVVNRPNYFNFNVYLDGSNTASLVETFPDLSMDPANPRYCISMLNSPTTGSQYVSVSDLVSGDAIPVGIGPFPDSYVPNESDLAPVGPQPLTGGTDGSETPVLASTTTTGDSPPVTLYTGAIPEGFDTLLDQVLVVNVPGCSLEGGAVDVLTLNTLIAWAANAGDKFIVIDGPAPDPAGLTETNYNTACTNEYLTLVSTGSPALTASTYAAVYAPWVLVQDPSSVTPGAARWLPPGPLMLAQYSYTDTAFGTFVTPAGTKNVLGLISLETQFTQYQLDTLNNAQVNTIKQVPGVGYCPFGGRTLHLGYPDRYIAVRRMIIKLEHDFKQLLQPMLFEPNDYLLWNSIVSVLTNYLTQQLQMGALAGTTPGQAYSVTCDNTNNTAAMAQAGVVTVDVAVALESPAEFININVTQYQGTGTTTVTTTT
jgi:hypothetical protein